MVKSFLEQLCNLLESELVLKSRRVVPGRLLQAGFDFQFPAWPEAAADLVDRWRHRFGGLDVKDVHRLRDLEKENARLKRLLAERDLEVDTLKETLTKNW